MREVIDFAVENSSQAIIDEKVAITKDPSEFNKDNFISTLSTDSLWEYRSQTATNYINGDNTIPSGNAPNYVAVAHIYIQDGKSLGTTDQKIFFEDKVYTNNDSVAMYIGGTNPAGKSVV